jgi:hypothetical protein
MCTEHETLKQNRWDHANSTYKGSCQTLLYEVMQSELFSILTNHKTQLGHCVTSDFAQNAFHI